MTTISAILKCSGICVVAITTGCASGTTTNVSARMGSVLYSDIAELRAAPSPPSMNANPDPATAWITVPVYFGTRRTINDRSIPAEYYGIADDALKYGVATVTIPEHRRPGKNDGRGICRFYPGRFHCGVNPTNSVTVARVEPREPDKWLQQLAALIDSGGTNADALVFVHGFNNSFADAMTRAAQLAYDAGFKGVVLSYDWTSENQLLRYTVDQENAERSAPDFARFLKRVADSAGAKTIAIIAHSMGTRLVSYALRDLQSEGVRMSLGPVIFAASDIDSAIFVDQYASKVRSTTTLLTLYASSNDKAILASEKIVHGAPRVGSGPPKLILYPGIDYVDAGPLDTDLIGHGYFAENKEVIDDIFLILRHGFGAIDRNLSEVQTGKEPYFRLK